MADEFGGIPVEEPQTDEFGGVAVAEPPRKSWISTVFTPPIGPGGKPWKVPSPDQSILGISPEMVPAGTTPATSALSAVGKTAAGLGQFLTSPQGMAETAAAATPAAPAIMAKWAYDMIRGGYKSTKAIVDELGQMANEAVNKGIITQNQLGPVPEGTTTQQHIQSLAENAANAVAMGLGVTGIAAHGLGRGKEAPEAPQTIPEEKAPPTVSAGEVPQQAPSAGEAKVGEAATSPTEPAKAEGGTAPPIEQAPPVTPPVTEPQSVGQKLAEEFEAEMRRKNELARKRLAGQLPEPTTTLPKLIEELGRDKVDALVGEWGDAELHPSGKSIVGYTDPRSKTGKTKLSTKEFLQWYENEQFTGMGGALAKGEIPETGAGGEKGGIAQRVREERAKAGQVEPIEPGTGISPRAAFERGQQLLNEGFDAPKALDDFEKTGAVSPDAVMAARAYGDKLNMAARKAELLGTESPQYKEAFRALSDWDKRTKPMGTAAHKIFQAHQGELDLDTGSFTELQRQRQSTSDKGFTESLKPKAEKIAATNKAAQEEVGKSQARLNDRIKKTVIKDPELAKVWDLAKKYLDENKGLYGFDDLRNKIAVDLGMKPDQVTKLLAKDRTTKKLADDLWIKQRNARRLKESAKMWLRELDTPGYTKALASIPNAMFSLSVFGHGFVALGTHAPIVAFQPRFWNAYVRNFGKMYKMVFSPAYYESQMADLVRRPNYDMARRAGLQNDPFQYEEFHTTAIRDLVKNWIGEKNMNRVDNFASAGNRGYGVLKLLRQDMFDQKWNKLPDKIKNEPNMARALSPDINHATGVTEKSAPKGANIALFAPRLAGSRVMWLLGDPIKTVGIIANWKNATAAERTFAVNQMREKGWVFGTFASLLALNQGFLHAAGSKQKINGIPEWMGGDVFDPLASDFMKFKVAGANIAYGGALLTMAKLPARVFTAILYDGKGSKYILEDERVDKVVGSYIRSQMSPFAGTVTDLAVGRDYQERPLPAKMFGTVEQTGAVPKRLQAQGVDEPYNWAEFAATKLPIPVSEGIKEGLRASGMSDDQANAWLKAWAVTSFMTGTGTRITEDTREE